MSYYFLIAEVYGKSSCVSRKDGFHGDHFIITSPSQEFDIAEYRKKGTILTAKRKCLLKTS
jgi:hypothetical protein